MADRESRSNDADRQRIEAEFLDRLQEEMRRMTVEDHILHLLRSLPSMAFQYMGIYQAEGMADLRQAKLAIDSFRALLDVLAPLRTPEEIAMYRSTLAQMQMTYVTAAEQQQAAGGRPAGDREPEPTWGTEEEGEPEEAVYEDEAEDSVPAVEDEAEDSVPAVEDEPGAGEQTSTKEE